MSIEYIVILHVGRKSDGNPGPLLRRHTGAAFEHRDEAVEYGRGLRMAPHKFYIGKLVSGMLLSVTWADELCQETHRCKNDDRMLQDAADQLSLTVHPQAPAMQPVELTISELQEKIHTWARECGWWDDYVAMPEQYRKYFLGTKRDLMHTEIAEATEGTRKGQMDDHLPHRKMEEVELGDAMIRIMDYAGAMGYDLAGAIREKMAYNESRADHKRENRALPGGKSV